MVTTLQRILGILLEDIIRDDYNKIMKMCLFSPGVIPHLFLKRLYLIIEIRDDIQCGIRCDRSKQVVAVNQFTINLPYRCVDGVITVAL